MDIIIIGKGRGWEDAPKQKGGRELWGVNDICLRRPVDLAFNMHNLTKHMTHALFNKTIEFVNMTCLPIITQKVYKHIPTSMAFPIEDFGRPYFTNSIDYMVAYALYKNRFQEYKDDIYMFGVEMRVGTEYAEQRPSLEYWIGMFEGDGGGVTIAEPTSVCRSLKGRYGYDWDEEDELHVKTREENK